MWLGAEFFFFILDILLFLRTGLHLHLLAAVHSSPVIKFAPPTPEDQDGSFVCRKNCPIHVKAEAGIGRCKRAGGYEDC